MLIRVPRNLSQGRPGRPYLEVLLHTDTYPARSTRLHLSLLHTHQPDEHDLVALTLPKLVENSRSVSSVLPAGARWPPWEVRAVLASLMAPTLLVILCMGARYRAHQLCLTTKPRSASACGSLMDFSARSSSTMVAGSSRSSSSIAARVLNGFSRNVFSRHGSLELEIRFNLWLHALARVAGTSSA